MADGMIVVVAASVALLPWIDAKPFGESNPNPLIDIPLVPKLASISSAVMGANSSEIRRILDEEEEEDTAWEDTSVGREAFVEDDGVFDAFLFFFFDPLCFMAGDASAAPPSNVGNGSRIGEKSWTAPCCSVGTFAVVVVIVAAIPLSSLQLLANTSGNDSASNAERPNAEIDDDEEVFEETVESWTWAWAWEDASTVA